jgi:hypothetical protein
MTGTKKCNIIDNNLLRLITRRGNFHLFEKFQDFMNTDRVSSQYVKNWQISPSLIPEFLGITLPSVQIDDEFVRQELNSICNESPVEIDKIVNLIDWMIVSFEKKLSGMELLTESYFKSRYEQQLDYIDANLRETLDAVFAEVLTPKGVSLVINRTAIELTVGYPWPKEHQSQIFATFGRNMYFTYRDKINFNIVRMMKIFSHALVDIVNKEMKGGVKRGSLPESFVAANARRLSEAVSFKNRRDFLDTEAVFALCAGQFYEGENHSVLVATMDPIDNFLIRLGVFKSLFNHIINEAVVEDAETWGLSMHPGWAIVMNKDMIPEYKIEVARILPLVDDIFHSKVEDWLLFHKTVFKTRRVS